MSPSHDPRSSNPLEESQPFESNMKRLLSQAYSPVRPPAGFAETTVQQMLAHAHVEAARRTRLRSPWRELANWRVAALFALCSLVAVGLGLAGGRRIERRTGASLERSAVASEIDESTGPIATVVAGVDAQWRHPLAASGRLGAGSLELIAGIVKIVFAKGAVMTLEGPVELELIDDSRCMLVRGSVTAKVPPDAVGFTVVTPAMQIVDLGTAFGVRVAPTAETEIHVFEGEVNLLGRDAAGATPKQLFGGEGVRVVHGAPVSIPANREHFVTDEDVTRRLEQRRELAYQAWLQYSTRWQRDPDVVLRYDFAAEGKTIRNTVDPQRHPAQSVNSAPRLVGGRWHHNKAMLFDGRTDVLVVDDHPDLRLDGDFTLAVWLRQATQPYAGWTRIVGKGFGTARNYGIWSPANGRLVWQICPKQEFEWWDTELASRIIDAANWHLIVGVLNDDIAKLYVDGRLELARAMARPVATSSDPLTIGRYGDVPAHEGYFLGEIDELVLLKRALSAGEIQEMYMTGQPSQGL